MEKIIDRVVNAFRRTARRVMQNVKSETVWKRNERGDVGNGNVDLCHRLEGLLQGTENRQWGDKNEQEFPVQGKKNETPAHPAGDILADGKRKALSIEVKCTGNTRESFEYSTPQKPSTESEAARPVVKAENTLHTETKEGVSKATKSANRKINLSDQADVEELLKKVEDIDKAIAEQIELTVNPASREKRGTIEELIEKWNRKDSSTSERT